MVTSMRLRLCLAGIAVACLGILAAQPGNDVRRVAFAAEALPANEPATWKSFMTARILEDILKTELDDASKSLRSAGTFLRGFRKIEVTGNMVALLGNVGTLILEGDDAKKAAALRDAGLQLTEAAKKKNFQDAKKAFDTIQAYPKKIEPAADAAPVKFEDLVDLDGLMKGVARIEVDTGAAVKKVGSSFDKDAKTMSAQSYLLACLAVASRVQNDAADWQKWCDEMRDGSVKLAEQFGKKNQSGASEARAELLKSCAECHEVYREET